MRRTNAKRKFDNYKTTDKDTKLKCNDLFSKMLEAYPRGRFVFLDGARAVTSRTLLRDGHDLSLSVIFNDCQETVRSIIGTIDNKIDVVHSELIEALEQWPEHKPFDGGWFDFTGATKDAIDVMEVVFRRRLIGASASFAITWCTRSGRRNDFAGEKHQRTNDAEAEITRLAERAGYMLAKLPGATTYRSMRYWSFRLRSFGSIASPDKSPTDAFHSALYDQASYGSKEWDVEKVINKYWDEDYDAWMCCVKWIGYDKTTWSLENVLKEDDCHESLENCPIVDDSHPFKQGNQGKPEKKKRKKTATATATATNNNNNPLDSSEIASTLIGVNSEADDLPELVAI